MIDQFENGASFILIAEVIHISVCRFDTATMFFANVFGKPDHGVSIFHSSANGHRFTLVEISNSLNSSSEMMIEELVFQSKVLFESSVQYNRSVSVGCVRKKYVSSFYCFEMINSFAQAVEVPKVIYISCMFSVK